MENQILVSILIPLYNKEKWFERCFNSVAKQTYNNIECIIVEDCSTDNSLELAEKLIINYTGTFKFILIKHEKNGGLSVSRNTGINNSNGEYVFFLDADDEITENCINSLVILAEKYPNVDIVQGNAYQYPRVDNDIYETKGKLPEFAAGNLEIRRNYYLNFPTTSWNKLVRKLFIIDNYLYFKPRLIHQDKHWLFFAIKKIESFAFTDEYCYIRYFVSDSITLNPNLLPSISGYLTIADDFLSNLDVDLLEELLIKVHSMLTAKDKIYSDEKYSSLIPKYEELASRVPTGSFLLSLALRTIRIEIKQGLKAIIKKLLGKKLTAKIKILIKK